MDVGAVINLILGLMTLLLGRRLFWLFAGLVGFLFGLAIAPFLPFTAGWPPWLTLVLGLGLGLVFALLSVWLQSLLIGVIGFLAGALIVFGLARLVGLSNPTLLIVAVLLGGVVGAGIVVMSFDWALILLSSLSGSSTVASAIVPLLNLDPSFFVWVQITLFIIGFGFQATQLRQERRAVYDT